ncbi:hypothetical protein ACJROX_16635 [Pseudalkalibacillus sp. A8]|uniref:hypothetical protein n=1 Tax=Pseudalkalibacillus sp. A8 TaxID=3382641 RepID=UPI0038B56BCB
MKYAIELFFDKKNERYVKGIWEGLKEKGITTNMADIEEIRPHITLAVYDSELPIDQYIQTFEKATIMIPSFKVKFQSLSIFPPSGNYLLGFSLYITFYYSYLYSQAYIVLLKKEILACLLLRLFLLYLHF